jgi:hypothetical protein
MHNKEAYEMAKKQAIEFDDGIGAKAIIANYIRIIIMNESGTLLTAAEDIIEIVREHDKQQQEDEQKKFEKLVRETPCANVV